MSNSNLEPLEVNPFVLMSLVDDGVYPSTNEPQIADFLSAYIGSMPVPTEIVGTIAPMVAPYLKAQFPWLEDAVKSMPENDPDNEGKFYDDEGEIPDTFAGFVRYMNLTYKAMGAIVAEHGETLMVQPLTKSERVEVEEAMLLKAMAGLSSRLDKD